MATSADQIAGWYRQYLGRDANPDEIENWQSGAYGATDPAGIEGQIAQSGEASDYRRTQGGDAGAGPQGPGGWGSGQGVGEAGPPPAVFDSGGGGGPWSSGGGNTWGAGTSQSPFGPWQGRYTAPGAQPLPDVPTWDPASVPAAPTFTPPAYTPPPAFSFDQPAPTYTPPPAFSYADFQAPSYTEAANDPGYQFRLQQGTQALQNSAAARGTLNDSGTLKALTDYGQGAASQEYQNVWNRALGGYTTNRGNALDAYNTNYKTQYQDPYAAALNQYTTDYGHARDTYGTNYQTQYQDPYAHAYQAAQDAFAPRMAEYQARVAAAQQQNQAGLLGYSTQAANIQHQNDLANTNAWNDYLLGWQDYEARRQQGVNFALGS